MSSRGRTHAAIARDLHATRTKLRQGRANLDKWYAHQSAVFVEGEKAGMTPREMAEACGPDPDTGKPFDVEYVRQVLRRHRAGVEQKPRRGR